MIDEFTPVLEGLLFSTIKDRIINDRTLVGGITPVDQSFEHKKAISLYENELAIAKNLHSYTDCVKLAKQREKKGMVIWYAKKYWKSVKQLNDGGDIGITKEFTFDNEPYYYYKGFTLSLGFFPAFRCTV